MPDLWSWNNWIDEAGSTPSGPSATDFPVGNLADSRMGRIWRSSMVGDNATFGFPGPRPVGVIAAFGGDMRGGDTFFLRLSANASGGWEMLNTTVAPAINPLTRQWVVRPADFGLPATVQVARIQVSPKRGRELGRLWCGAADWEPRTTHVFGAEFGVIDYGTRAVAPRSGAVLPSPGAKLRSAMVKYDGLFWDEVEGPARDIALFCGATRQILFVPNDQVYSRESAATLGYLDELNPIIVAGWGRGERQFRIVESG